MDCSLKFPACSHCYFHFQTEIIITKIYVTAFQRKTQMITFRTVKSLIVELSSKNQPVMKRRQEEPQSAAGLLFSHVVWWDQQRIFLLYGQSRTFQFQQIFQFCQRINERRISQLRNLLLWNKMGQIVSRFCCISIQVLQSFLFITRHLLISVNPFKYSSDPFMLGSWNQCHH